MTGREQGARAPARLAERLQAARHHLFVGRSAELDLFRQALAAPELPFLVLYVFGPGGVGKTSLLGEFQRLAREAGADCICLDGRNLEPTPASFQEGLRAVMGLGPEPLPSEVMAGRPRRQVLFLDTYEALAPLDGWLRDIFLPQLPEQVFIVLAGRRPPTAPWRSDPGWRSLIRVLSLRNLSREESEDFLARREVPPAQRGRILSFTCGHPLALSLAADTFAQNPGACSFQPEEALDVVRTLLARFLEEVPGPTHRAALEVCSIVRSTTESLLSAALQLPEAPQLFDWLAGLSCIECGPQGLFPHDLVREAVVADLRWRNPVRYAELRRRVRSYYADRLADVSGAEQQRLLFDYIYLHRGNPVVRPFFEWGEGPGLVARPAEPRDIPHLVRMVETHEGSESARLASYWLERQPHRALVVRDEGPEPAGFLLMLALEETDAQERDRDPALARAWRALSGRAPLRPGEKATYFRFWMGRDSYQSVSCVQSALFVNMVRHYLVTPGLVATFVACADAEFWGPIFSYAESCRWPEADFEVGGRHYGVYWNDWRRMPPLSWLNLLADKEIATQAPAPEAPRPAPQVVVLSREDFAAAVHEALKNYGSPAALRLSPLLNSRMVVEQAGEDSDRPRRVEALRALLHGAVQALGSSPRRARAQRALVRTYIEPAPSQEKAAEMLDLPFSTYRRHLKEGLTQVSELLWEQEIGEWK
jgi:hypothetical protein